MAGGLVASLSRRPGCACPGWCCSSASGWRSAPTGLGWIHFDDYELARTIGIVALALILFEGGLTAGFGEIRPVLGPRSASRSSARSSTAMIAGLAAAWLFDLSLLEGLLLGSIVAATDGAAIFALLRGSTLRRRLALTLEGEAGINDPVAVLLVHRVHRLDPAAGLRRRRHGRAARAASSGSALAVGVGRRLAGDRGAPSACAWRARPVSGRVPRASRRSRSARADALHGSGFLAVYLVGLALGSAPIPAQADDHGVPPGARLARAAGDVPDARPPRVPVAARRGRASRERCSRWSSSSSRARWRRSSRRRGRASTPRAGRPRLGRPARRRSRRARDLPRDRRFPAERSSSSTSSSSRCCCRPCSRARPSSRSPGVYSSRAI